MDKEQKKILYKRVKIIKKNSFKILNFIATIVTIVGIGIIGIIQPFKDNIPLIHKYELMKNIEDIKITQSKEFVESILGIANGIKTWKYNGDEIERNIYINEYFILLCYYDNDSLNSFLIITRDDRFNYTDYRTGTKLCKDNFKVAFENVQGLPLFIKANVGGRLDCNRFYYEVFEENFRGDYMTVGYGVCDIGVWSDDIEESLTPSLFSDEFDIISDEDMYVYNQLEILQDTSLRENGINSVLISNMSEEFINEYIINDCFAGITKGDFMNLDFDIYD